MYCHFSVSRWYTPNCSANALLQVGMACGTEPCSKSLFPAEVLSFCHHMNFLHSQLRYFVLKLYDRFVVILLKQLSGTKPRKVWVGNSQPRLYQVMRYFVLLPLLASLANRRFIIQKYFWLSVIGYENNCKSYLTNLLAHLSRGVVYSTLKFTWAV